MSFHKAKDHLKTYQLESNIREFSTSSATVALAAEALGCREAEIAKTMAFVVGDQVILIVTAGDQKIDNSKYKAKFQTKAKMLPVELVEEKVGHEVGGVCPFGIKDNVIVYLDESLKAYEIIYPACGSHNSAVKLNLSQLEKASQFQEWIDVCKKREN